MVCCLCNEKSNLIIRALPTRLCETHVFVSPRVAHSFSAFLIAAQPGWQGVKESRAVNDNNTVESLLSSPSPAGSNWPGTNQAAGRLVTADIKRYRGKWYTRPAQRWEQVECINDWVIRWMLDNYTNPPIERRHTTDLVARLKAMRAVSEVTPGLPLLNGILDDGSIVPYTTDTFAPYSTNYDYEPEAGCPRWIRFLEEVVPGSTDRRTLQQFAGYVLEDRQRRQRFLLLKGSGGDGKSVFTSVLSALVPKASATTLKALEGRFGLQRLLHSWLNISPEASVTSQAAEEKLKAITGGDLVEVEMKNMTPVEASLRTKMILHVNSLPRFVDPSSALYRRLLVVEFPVQVRLVKEEDAHLLDKLLTELPGILNWALEGLKDLREHGFVVSEHSRAIIESTHEAANPLIGFLGDETGPGGSVQVSEMYTTYKQWCLENGYKPLAVSQFGIRLREAGALAGLDIRKTRVREQGSRLYVYEGVSLLPDQAPPAPLY